MAVAVQEQQLTDNVPQLVGNRLQPCSSTQFHKCYVWPGGHRDFHIASQ